GGVRVAGCVSAQARLAGDVEDAAASGRFHQGKDRAHELERGGQVDGDDAVPDSIRRLTGGREVVVDAGDVRERIDAVPGCGEHGVDRLLLREVACDGDDA